MTLSPAEMAQGNSPPVARSPEGVAGCTSRRPARRGCCLPSTSLRQRTRTARSCDSTPATGRIAAREAEDIHRHVSCRLRAVAEAAAGVLTPAFHGAAGRHRAAVELRRADRRDAARETRDVDWYEALRNRIVAELAVVVEAPALHSAGVRQCAGVRLTQPNHRDTIRGEAADAHRQGTGMPRTVPKLPVEAVTPASHVAPRGAHAACGAARR